MCSSSPPKPPPPPVIPPPPPPPDTNDQLNPVTAPSNPQVKRRQASINTFRKDLTIQGGGYSGLNVPQ